MAWRAIQAALPREAIISSDIGNNCAIGNAYPTLRGRPQIPGARPVRTVRLRPAVDRRRQDRLPRHAGGRLCRGRRLRHRLRRADGDRPQGMAGDHHGGVPQLPMGCGEAQFDALVRRQFRRHRTRHAGLLRRHRQRLRPAGRAGQDHGRADRGAGQGDRGPDAARQDHADRGDDQPGARRAVPPRRDEDAGRRGRDRPGGHAAARRRRSAARESGSKPKRIRAATRSAATERWLL